MAQNWTRDSKLSVPMHYQSHHKDHQRPSTVWSTLTVSSLYRFSVQQQNWSTHPTTKLIHPLPCTCSNHLITTDAVESPIENELMSIRQFYFTCISSVLFQKDMYTNFSMCLSSKDTSVSSIRQGATHSLQFTWVLLMGKVQWHID